MSPCTYGPQHACFINYQFVPVCKTSSGTQVTALQLLQ